MATFRLVCKDWKNEPSELFYRTDDSILWGAGALEQGYTLPPVPPASFKGGEIVGKESPRVLKIQLGLACNYSCSYCSQKSVPNDVRDLDVDRFLREIDSQAIRPDRIEFWGGEPLVYKEALLQLATQLRCRFPEAIFWMPTNGSLLTKELADALVSLDFAISISHDGPGQSFRGEDPLLNAETRASILYLFSKLHPLKKMSFNFCLHGGNTSRAAVLKFFKDFTGQDDVQLGEGALIDAYDSDGRKLSDFDHAVFSKQALHEMISGAANPANIQIVNNKVNSFINSIVYRRELRDVPQKCGMDKRENVAVTLSGKVLTCQNTSAVSVSANGNSHHIGNLNELDAVHLNTVTLWGDREDCKVCPVVHLCGGSCMFLQGHEWEASCKNSFADNVAFFAVAIRELTGLVLDEIHLLDGDETKHWKPFKSVSKRKFPIFKIGVANETRDR